ncbi:MAG: DsbE family thiol:disulfide interchange protein [Rhodospirillaceae bacterium]|jgi:cytochrome c biogenesis protein CcmG, thiol:disulfide interchange protein DsbE|nr:DsbE family thiol:disulfide interchange protein [Rhodospirillaceae bacterium]MBT6136600.1 DsbE family thiol:disulfide interchange protein [Rhodospirillaceae bacterium]
MGRLLYLLPLVIFGAIAAYFAAPILSGKDPKTLPSAMIDKPAPTQTLPPLVDGKPGIDAAALAGPVKLVNFFASWCVPCRAEHPLLTRYAASGKIRLYGINYKNKKEEALAWLAELGDPYERIGFDLSGRAGIEWGVYGVPETYVVDAKGIIRYRHVGPLTQLVMAETIMPLVEKLEAGGGS